MELNDSGDALQSNVMAFSTESSAYPGSIIERVAYIGNALLVESLQDMTLDLSVGYLRRTEIDSFLCQPLLSDAGISVVLWLESQGQPGFGFNELDQVEACAQRWLDRCQDVAFRRQISVASLFGDMFTGQVGAGVLNTPASERTERLSASLESASALERHLRMFERAVKSADTGFLITDPRMPDNPIVYCNPAFERISGYAFREVVGRNCRFLQGEDREQPGLVQLRDALRKQTGCRVTLKNVRKDGVPFWNELHVAPILDDEGQLTHYIGIQNDVTRRVQAQQALIESERRYSALFNNSLDGVVYYSLAGECIQVNQAFCTMLGYDEQTLKRLSYQQLTPEKWREREARIMQEQVLPRGYSDLYEKEFIHKDGSTLPVSVRFVLQPGQDEGRRVMWGLVRDISASKRAFADIQRQGVLLNETGKLAKVGGWEINLQTGEERWTDEIYRILELDLAITPSQDVLFGCVVEEYREGAQAVVAEAITHNSPFLLEVPILTAHQRRKWLRLVGESVQDGVQQAMMYGAIQDITQQKNSEQKLRENEARMQYLAHHDPLTKMPNRLLFQDRLRHGLERAKRNRTKLGVMLIDLDRFKVINDTLGHDVGDQFLKDIARRLLDSLRDGDTAARIGGDEFVLIVEDVRESGDVAVVARKVLRVIAQPCMVDNHELYSTASVGISLYPGDGDSVEGLLKTADAAMYRAKERGKNNFQFYTDDINKRAFELMLLENDLRKALEKDQFFVEYQPQFDLASGDLTGVEALMRWQHAEQGLIPPGVFIPIAEETGLIVPLGNWMLQESCRQVREWLNAGLYLEKVAVNLSARQFRQPGLADFILEVLSATQLTPDYLELEITESVAMDDVEVTIAMLQDLKRMGLKLSIDDFGTGYSSLSYLKRFAIDKLKIDQSFVRDLVTDPNDAAIAASTIALAHKMNLRVIAEGVENADQVAFLKAQDCDEVQGYFYGRPMSADKFRVLLHQHTLRRNQRLGGEVRPSQSRTDTQPRADSNSGRSRNA